MTALPWWKRVVRWGQTNLTEDDPARCDLDFWRAYWKRGAIQGVIVNASGIVSYYPSASGLQYRAATLGERDFYGEFSAAAREQGIAAVARMDVNRCTEEFYRAHPDWFCVDIEGKPITSQGRYFSCVNGGYYSEFIPETLREIISRYHPDGFTDNSWSGVGRKTICYCENCRASFREATGLELPRKAEWDEPNYPQWVRWGAERRTQIWDLFNEVTTSAGGEDCLWSGMLHADPFSGCDSLRDLAALCSRAKIIFTDHQSRDELNGFEQNSLNGSLLRMVSGNENIVVPESIAHYVRGERTFRLAANPAAESQTWLTSGIAGGISPWYHHIGGSTRDRRQFDTSAELFAWHKKNQDALYDRFDLARVGLVWDQDNAAYFGREQRRNRVSLPWRGFHHALVRARVPFMPVNAANLARDLDRLEVIVLPNVAILKDEAREAILKHLERGGGLVLTGETDTFAADGKTPVNGLLNTLGLRFSGEVLGSSVASASWEDFNAHNYLRLPDGERHPVLESFEKTEIAPLGGTVKVVSDGGKLSPVASYVSPFPIYPPEFSWIREERPDIGTIFAGELESGARIVYFAADIDRACGAQMLPDHAQLLSNAVRWAAKGDQPLAVTGPGYLDCRVYQQDARVIVHVVNLSGLNRRGYVEEALPVGPVRISVECGEALTARAALRVAGVEADIEVINERAEITLDRVGAHELIVFEFDK